MDSLDDWDVVHEWEVVDFHSSGRGCRGCSPLSVENVFSCSSDEAPASSEFPVIGGPLVGLADCVHDRQCVFPSSNGKLSADNGECVFGVKSLSRSLLRDKTRLCATAAQEMLLQHFDDTELDLLSFNEPHRFSESRVLEAGTIVSNGGGVVSSVDERVDSNSCSSRHVRGVPDATDAEEMCTCGFFVAWRLVFSVFCQMDVFTHILCLMQFVYFLSHFFWRRGTFDDCSAPQPCSFIKGVASYVLFLMIGVGPLLVVAEGVFCKHLHLGHVEGAGNMVKRRAEAQKIALSIYRSLLVVVLAFLFRAELDENGENEEVNQVDKRIGEKGRLPRTPVLRMRCGVVIFFFITNAFLLQVILLRCPDMTH
uniref:Uncharacterized protein TCIL3000_10_2940 n=1 Tax=Trypanosoma congolense (strain IL3000) TaxID=1068625 RepID=G0UVW7_TRYCI|nr:unnamed protein product [Trypanosoma congolense IL3000]